MIRTGWFSTELHDNYVGGVEALEEGLAVDEVEALAGVTAEVADDEVDGVGVATDGRV